MIDVIADILKREKGFVDDPDDGGGPTNHGITVKALCEYRQQLTAWVAGYGSVAPLGYVIVYIVVIAFSLPGGAVMTVAGGFLFGVAFGAVLSVIGATTVAKVRYIKQMGSRRPICSDPKAAIIKNTVRIAYLK